MPTKECAEITSSRYFQSLTESSILKLFEDSNEKELRRCEAAGKQYLEEYDAEDGDVDDGAK